MPRAVTLRCPPSLARGRQAAPSPRGAATLVVKGVPARVCPNCGEEYVEDDVLKRLLEQAEEAARSGVQVDIREYLAA